MNLYNFYDKQAYLKIEIIKIKTFILIYEFINKIISTLI